MNIYVGNLAYSTTDSSLEEAFGPHGTVERAKVVIDRNTGRSRGFGFVTYAEGEAAAKAIVAGCWGGVQSRPRPARDRVWAHDLARKPARKRDRVPSQVVVRFRWAPKSVIVLLAKAR